MNTLSLKNKVDVQDLAEQFEQMAKDEIKYFFEENTELLKDLIKIYNGEEWEIIDEISAIVVCEGYSTLEKLLIGFIERYADEKTVNSIITKYNLK